MGETDYRIQDRVREYSRELDRLSGGTLGVFAETGRALYRSRAMEAAASIAYYAIFSLFPLSLVAIVIGSNALQGQAARQQVFMVLNRILPVSIDFVERNLDQVLAERGSIGVLGVAGLLWSASGVFTALVNHINRAWPEAEGRNIIRRRILGLGIIALLLGSLFLLWLISNTALNLVPELAFPGLDQLAFLESIWGRVTSNLIPGLIILITFVLLYRLVPNYPVGWWDAFWGALAAALAWWGAAEMFGWYVRSGLANYSLVYGSLGAVVALMFWIYISSLIILFGAHLSAAVTRTRRPPAHQT